MTTASLAAVRSPSRWATIGLAAVATPWAFLILGETVTGVQAVGMAVVIALLAAFTLTSRREVPSVLDNGELGGPSG